MRPDQIARLADLSESLAEDVLAEADPLNWPGAGVAFEDWDKAVRGDRYWMKKNAAASLSLLTSVERLRADKTPAGSGVTDPEVDLDKAIASAERQAAAMLERVGRAGSTG